MVDIQQDQLNTFYDNSTLYIITKNKDIWNEFQEMKLEWMKKGLNSDEYSLEVDNVETDMLDFYNLLLLNNYQSEKVYFSYDPDFFYLNGVEIDDTVYTIKMIIHKVEAEAEAKAKAEAEAKAKAEAEAEAENSIEELFNSMVSKIDELLI
jgi:hypothetical protein